MYAGTPAAGGLCADAHWMRAQDGEGRWNRFTGRYPWDPSCICAGDPQYGGTGAPKEGSCFGAAPNVDHSNERVRQVSPCTTVLL